MWIYRGILACARAPEVRAFARRHLATERKHLGEITGLLPQDERSALLPLWRAAGWLTGALPALFGAGAVYRTIDAVETFVDLHYLTQIEYLDKLGAHREIRATLAACRADEVHHRDEARTLAAGRAGPLTRLWIWVVGRGSQAAVAAARHV